MYPLTAQENNKSYRSLNCPGVITPEKKYKS